MGTEYPNFMKLKNGSSWQHELSQKDFPSDSIWASFYEELLVFLNKLNNQFPQHKFAGDIHGRLQGNANLRDSAFAELASLKYIVSQLQCSVIELQPKGANGTEGEFLVRDLVGNEVFCEVKHPGWKGSASPERRKLPKYFQGDSGSFDNISDIRDTIKRAYNKFDPRRLNLLVINDDFMVSLNRERDKEYRDAKQALFSDPGGCFGSSQFENLGGVAVFNYDNPSRCTEIRQEWRVFPNPYAIKPLPASWTPARSRPG